jgi:hypothetical protein
MSPDDKHHRLSDSLKGVAMRLEILAIIASLEGLTGIACFEEEKRQIIAVIEMLRKLLEGHPETPADAFWE